MGFTALTSIGLPFWVNIYFTLYGVINVMVVIAQVDLIRRVRSLLKQGLRFKRKKIEIGHSSFGMAFMVAVTIVGQALFIMLFHKYHQ